MPSFLVCLCLAALAACAGSRSGDFAGAPVVLISVDTLRADHLPVYGYRAVATPAIDALRRDAILFENAYTSVPLTLPAHTSLLTGLPPDRHGVRDNLGYRLDGKIETLPGLLRRHGYATGAAVSAYVLRGSTGLAASFESYDDGVEILADQPLAQIRRPGRQTAARALQWIEGHRGQPFVFLLHLYEPHAPYQPPEPFAARYRERPYDGEIAYVDTVLGEFLDRLRALGVYDRAIVVFLSDHGEGLGDHGEKEHGVLLYQETVRVPLLLKLPGALRRGETVRAPAELLDVFPTVLGLLGREPPAGLPGRSLLALPARPAKPLYSETFYPYLHLGWSGLRALRDERFLYIEGPDPELYDLAADPGEHKNLRDADRRTAHGLRVELAGRPVALAPPRASSAEERGKLAALGYLTSGGSVAPAARAIDPKRALPDLESLTSAYRLAAQGENARAAALLRPLVERYPGMIDARFQLASNLGALGRDEEALAEYERTIALAPMAADGPRIEEGRLLVRMRRPDQAAAAARAALAGQPEEAHEILARVAAARQRIGEAEAEARQAVAAESPPRAEAVLLLAETQSLNGRPREALDTLQPLAERIAKGERPPLRGLDFTRGDALARLGDANAANDANAADTAEAAFRREIALFPRDTRAYAGLAYLLASRGRTGEIDAVLQALAAASPTREGYLAAAAAADRLGNPAAAAAWRRRAAVGHTRSPLSGALDRR